MNVLNKFPELKELLSTPESLSLICFNINSNRYKTIGISKISSILGMNEEKIEKVSRVFEKMKMAKIHRIGMEISVEMVEDYDDKVKDVIYEVIWENKDAYSDIYKSLIKMHADETCN